MAEKVEILRSILRRILILALLTGALGAQADQSDLTRLARELRTALEKKDLTIAADLATQLDHDVQLRYRAWLIRDAQKWVDDVLTWLPPDTETLFVNQEPFVVDPSESPEALYGRPTQIYAIDRLSALNAGEFYRALEGRTISLVAAGARDIRGPGTGVPALSPDSEVVNFLFLAEALHPNVLGAPDKSLQNCPVWRAIAKIHVGESWRVSQRDDESWLALARPDLLVIASKENLLDELLQRIAQGSPMRALPPTLPEWEHVNRLAPFWGLRHYPGSGAREDGSNPRVAKGGNLRRDASAVGVAVQYDSGRERLEIHYLSAAAKVSDPTRDHPAPEFQTEYTQPGVVRLTSDTRARGDFPFHFAVFMLGFGRYR